MGSQNGVGRVTIPRRVSRVSHLVLILSGGREFSPGGADAMGCVPTLGLGMHNTAVLASRSDSVHLECIESPAVDFFYHCLLL